MIQIEVDYSPRQQRYQISGHIEDFDLRASLNPLLMVHRISEEIMFEVCKGATERLKPHIEKAVKKTLETLGTNIDTAIKEAFSE